VTLKISDKGSIVTNSVTIEDVPAVRITGNSV
jgi:hypothetical protein